MKKAVKEYLLYMLGGALIALVTIGTLLYFLTLMGVQL